MLRFLNATVISVIPYTWNRIWPLQTSSSSRPLVCTPPPPNKAEECGSTCNNIFLHLPTCFDPIVRHAAPNFGCCHKHSTDLLHFCLKTLVGIRLWISGIKHLLVRDSVSEELEIIWVEYEKYANQQFPIGMRCNEYNTKCTYVHVTSLPTAAEAVRAWWVQKDSREYEYLVKKQKRKIYCVHLYFYIFFGKSSTYFRSEQIPS